MRDIKSDLKYRYIEVGNYWADFAACSDKEYMADFFRRHYSEIILNS